jgi:hypothetical protein
MNGPNFARIAAQLHHSQSIGSDEPFDWESMDADVRGWWETVAMGVIAAFVSAGTGAAVEIVTDQGLRSRATGINGGGQAMPQFELDIEACRLAEEYSRLRDRLVSEISCPAAPWHGSAASAAAEELVAFCDDLLLEPEDDE